MKRYTVKDKPSDANTYHKRTSTALVWVDEAFEVVTDMGYRVVSPSTPGWDKGYFVAWPVGTDGRTIGLPWPVPAAFARRHYFAGPHEED